MIYSLMGDYYIVLMEINSHFHTDDTIIMLRATVSMRNGNRF